MLGGSESGTVASQRGLAAVSGQPSSAAEGVFGPGVIGARALVASRLVSRVQPSSGS